MKGCILPNGIWVLHCGDFAAGQTINPSSAEVHLMSLVENFRVSFFLPEVHCSCKKCDTENGMHCMKRWEPYRLVIKRKRRSMEKYEIYPKDNKHYYPC